MNTNTELTSAERAPVLDLRYLTGPAYLPLAPCTALPGLRSDEDARRIVSPHRLHRLVEAGEVLELRAPDECVRSSLSPLSVRIADPDSARPWGSPAESGSRGFVFFPIADAEGRGATLSSAFCEVLLANPNVPIRDLVDCYAVTQTDLLTELREFAEQGVSDRELSWRMVLRDLLHGLRYGVLLASRPNTGPNARLIAGTGLGKRATMPGAGSMVRVATDETSVIEIATQCEQGSVAIRDLRGEAFLLTLGTGEVRWRGVEEDGTLHCCACHNCGGFCSWSTRRPTFPVDVVVDAGHGPISRGRVLDAEQLAQVPTRTLVRAADGTIAGRVTDSHGVVLGDGRTFPWSLLPAPALVLWSDLDEHDTTAGWDG